MGNGPRLWLRKLEAAAYSGSTKMVLSKQSLSYCLPFEFILDLLLELDLSCNLFLEVPKEIFALTKLTTLDLSDNKISHISGVGFRSLSNLKRLTLCRNKLTTVEPRVLPNSLEFIDVSFNTLTELRFIAKLPSLRVIRATNNNISDLPRIPGTSVIEELELVRSQPPCSGIS
jgi:Leucine-rich repeat (LRR) protein